MKVIVIGASGGSGQAALRALLDQGHEVTAFARGAARLAQAIQSPLLHCVAGDALNAAELDAAIAGHDAVIVTLGIRESAIGVRLRGPRATALDVRSTGTRHAIAAMRRHGVRRLVVQTTFGAGETRAKLPWLYRLMFAALLKPQIADTEVQEQAVRASGLDWTLVQPVNLSDADEAAEPHLSVDGATRRMVVTRGQVGRVLAGALQRREFVGRSVAVSGA